MDGGSDAGLLTGRPADDHVGLAGGAVVGPHVVVDRHGREVVTEHPPTVRVELHEPDRPEPAGRVQPQRMRADATEQVENIEHILRLLNGAIDFNQRRQRSSLVLPMWPAAMPSTICTVRVYRS